jgi:hypothetical protein
VVARRRSFNGGSVTWRDPVRKAAQQEHGKRERREQIGPVLDFEGCFSKSTRELRQGIATMVSREFVLRGPEPGVCWNGYAENASGGQDAPYLAEQRCRVGDVFEDVEEPRRAELACLEGGSLQRRADDVVESAPPRVASARHAGFEEDRGDCSAFQCRADRAVPAPDVEKRAGEGASLQGTDDAGVAVCEPERLVLEVKARIVPVLGEAQRFRLSGGGSTDPYPVAVLLEILVPMP